MVGRRWFGVLISIAVISLVTGRKSRKHSSAHQSYSPKDQSGTSPREIFDRFQDITADNCQDANSEEQTIDIQLDYGRWKSSTNLALFLANLYTTRLEQLGGSLESMPDTSFFSFLQALVASGRPLVFGAAAIFEPGIFQRHSGHFQVYAFLNDGTVAASNTAAVYDFRDNESYQKLTQSFWTKVREEEFITTEGGVGTIDISLDGLDVNQCDDNEGPVDAFLDAFRGTHRCPSGAKCVFKSGFGFRPGGYECVADNGCVLQGRDLEKASGRKLRKLLQKCRRYGHQSKSKGKRRNKGY